MLLYTERLILREFSPDDFDGVHEYASDPENVKHMVFGPNTPEDTRDYLERQCAEEREAVPRMHYNIALEEASLKKVIGGISIHLNWRRDDGILGVILNKRHTGRGYTTEALGGVLAFAFGELGLHRVHAVVDVENAAMIHIFGKVGMRNEGRMVRRGKSRPEAEEPYFDQFGFAILREEWQAAERITV